MGLTYDMWIIYFISMAQSKGFSPGDAATFVSVAGIGSLIARIAQAFLVDRGVISPCFLMGITITVISVSLGATPWLTSYWMMMTSSLAVLTGNGVLVCLNDVLMKQVLGVEVLASGFGWVGIKASLIVSAFGFLPGECFDYF